MNIEGQWVGEIKGTNDGKLFLELSQNSDQVLGEARIADSRFGTAVFEISGHISGNTARIDLSPVASTPGTILGYGNATVRLIGENKLEGIWKTQIGTGGVFVATKMTSQVLTGDYLFQNSTTALTANPIARVFIVHGHDEVVKEKTARFLEHLNIEPIILHEKANHGDTIIEKIDRFSNVEFAVILLTPDDIGSLNTDAKQKPRGRQNVVLELGYFLAKLGRNKVAVIKKHDVEIPSDVIGVVYIEYDINDGWKLRLAKELKQAGINVDLNRIR